MSSQFPSICVSILNWNDFNNTIECIKSILNNSYNNFDIVLVDNNSNYKNLHKILQWFKKEKIKYHNINYFSEKKNLITKLTPPRETKIFLHRIRVKDTVRFAKNLGNAKGHNKGLNFALKNNYDFVMTIDCDFIIGRSFLKSMIHTFKKNTNCVAVSPKVYYWIKKKTRIIWWSGLNLNKNYIIFQKTGKGARRQLDNGQFKGCIESDSTGGCSVYKTNILKKTGLLDEDFFFGPADVLLSQKLKKFGDIIVNHDCYVYHKVSQSIFISGIKSRIYFETLGWLVFIKKTCKFYDKVLGYLFFLFRSLLHFLRIIYKKDKDPHIGFVLGVKDFFLKKI